MQKLPFDKIYCLHCLEYPDRFESSQNTFKELNILNNVEYWYTVKRPISNICGNKILSLHSGYYDNIRAFNPNVYGGVFNCALEHYNIIKTSYLRGFNNILIFEDDISTNINKNEFKFVLNNLPNDYDFITFNNDMHRNNLSLKTYYEKYKTLFIKHTNIFNKFINSTCCYALNRNGMKFYIDFNDRLFSYADKFWMFIDKSIYNLYEIGPKIFEPRSNKSIIIQD